MHPIYESMFNLLEAVVPEYSGAGVIREPSGTTVTGIVPTNTYRCRDGKYVVIGGNGDSIFKRLMRPWAAPISRRMSAWPTMPAAYATKRKSTPPSPPGPKR